ncbi:hypothetical protein L218DRAFT_765397 [Marasmius fiardii PR-910]|nr:hypothetical protein L218DRAFT_765397 [Marasmius fiardii PR-910]
MASSSLYTMATQRLPLPGGEYGTHQISRVYQTTNPIVKLRDGTVLSEARLHCAVV